MDCGLRGSRERNAIPESGPWYQRAKGSRRERPRNRKKRQRETRFLRAQCCHREHSTVSGLMSYSLICAHSLKHFSCIPQLTDFFAFFTQWPPGNAKFDVDDTSQLHCPVMHKDEIGWKLSKNKSFLGRFFVLIQMLFNYEVFFYFLEPHSS